MLRRALRPSVLLVLLASCSAGLHGVPASMRDWNEPFEPFRVAGNVHYVGTNRMAIYLITTPAGHILLDSGFEVAVPRLKQNVQALGFRFEDIKILLFSHAHIDHVQAHLMVKQMTGARVLSSEPDAPTVTSGGQHEWAYGDTFAWPPCPVDGLVKDGDVVELGGTRLTARLTPGHSKGATTWTMTVDEEGKQLAVVFYPSGNIPPGAKLIGNPAFPEVVAAYEASFAVWRSLPCDVFLGAHGEFFDLQKKWKRMKKGEGRQVFVDPEGYRQAIAAAEKKFRAQLDSER
jgi:metallo-beta-lactamase class B